MEFILSDNMGAEKKLSTIAALREFLQLPSRYWKEGTGDSSLAMNQEERLIFFKVNVEVFIMLHPDYISPVIDSRRTGKQVHYVGGEEMVIPEKFLCSEEVAFEIFSFYVANGELGDRFSWVDIYG